MRVKLSKNLALPAEAATQTFLVVGKRGSGKSTTCVRLAEQFIKAGVPIVVIDPVDQWWGLKASRDGKGPGLGVYVFGGSHADLPIEATAGIVIADAIIEHRISAVLSVKHLSGRERGQFVSDLAGRLFQRNREPIHIFLEEAHEVAPQQPFRGEEEMLGRVTRLWKLGRSAGLGGSAITQRPASLSKNVTTQAEILIVHRMLGPQDVAAVREWIRYHGERDDILGELSTLKTGEAFIWAPDFPEGNPVGLKRIQILDRETFDSSATPKVGHRVTEPRALAPVDVSSLQKQMAATIEKAKAEDPKELRRRIAQLEADLRKKAKAVAPAPAAPTPVRDVAAERKMREEVEAARREIEAERKRTERAIAQANRKLQEWNEKVVRSARRATAALAEILPEEFSLEVPPATDWTTRFTITPDKPNPEFRRRVGDAVRSAKKGGAVVADERGDVVFEVGEKDIRAMQEGKAARLEPAYGDFRITPAFSRILCALDYLHSLGVEKPTRKQIAFFADASPTSSSYANNLSTLHTNGLVAYAPGSTVFLTPAGKSAVEGLDEKPEIPTTTEELHEQVLARIQPALVNLMRVLLEVYPSPLTRAELAEKAGPSLTSSSYANNLSTLHTAGVIDYGPGSTVVASSLLFLEGA